MTALDLTAAWPVRTVAAAVIRAGDTVSTIGPTDHVFRLASLAKPISTWAMLVAVEEGIITLDSPAGQPGCTLRHLLAHAGGYPFDGREPTPPIGPTGRARPTPGRRRRTGQAGSTNSWRSAPPRTRSTR